MLSRFAQSVLFAVLVLAPYAAGAQVFEASGTVVDIGEGAGPLALGTSCTIQFELDPNTVASFDTPTFSAYDDALSNASVTLGTGESLVVPLASVNAIAGVPDFWDGFLDAFAGTTDIPNFTHPTFGFMEFAFVQLELTDSTGTAYQQSPPELLPPTDPPFDGKMMRFQWFAQSEDSISVGCLLGEIAPPQPIPVPLWDARMALIAFVLLGLTLVAGLRRALS